jgi:hypothetical protein
MMPPDVFGPAVKQVPVDREAWEHGMASVHRQTRAPEFASPQPDRCPALEVKMASSSIWPMVAPWKQRTSLFQFPLSGVYLSLSGWSNSCCTARRRFSLHSADNYCAAEYTF